MDVVLPILLYGATGGALTVAVAIGGAAILTHSLELRLSLLLHCALNTSRLHIGIGGDFRLYGVTLENLSETEGHEEEGHNGDTYENYYEY